MTTDRTEKLERMRHSFAHVLSMAVLRLYKDAKLGIGPAIENGFYHDFEFPVEIGMKDLDAISNEINNIINEEIPFQQLVIQRAQAFDILHLQGQIYKTEILNSIPDAQVSFYKTGNEFMDLCRGPHVDHTGMLGAFKLTGISGVHWNNDESRPLMQRIHGIAFETKEELDAYLNEEEEKKSKDHKKLSVLYDFFTFEKDNGAGLPIWLPKGEAIKRTIQDYVFKSNLKTGSNYVSTPLILRTEVNKKLIDRKNSNFDFPEIDLDGSSYSLKTKHILNHLQIFKHKKRSYRELPLRLSEFGDIHRNEKTGELDGLLRLRSFKVDSTTIFLTKDQLKNEIRNSLKQIIKTYEDFELKDYRIELALRGNNDSNYEGNPKDWYKLQEILVEVVKSLNINVFETPNSASSVGPGINFKMTDINNKLWKIGSIYFDLYHPKLFDISYVDSNNKEKLPYVICKSTIGSLERFFALLIENMDGTLPVWLAPIQVNIIPISEKYLDYSNMVRDMLIEKEFKVVVDEAPETMQNKIRESQNNLIPYMLIVGEKEASTNTVSVRPRSGQDLGMMKIDEFIEKLKSEIENKSGF